jgi:hypothetical protein
MKLLAIGRSHMNLQPRPFKVEVTRLKPRGYIVEQKTIDNIISIKITEQHFAPKIREQTFSSVPRYEIARNW